jgi:hypothetical protein
LPRHTFAFLCLTVFGFASTASAQAPPIGATCTVFPANNIWNTAVDQLPVAPNSSTYVNTIGAGTGVHPDFGSGLYAGGPIGIPFITVPGTQTKYPATFTYADESDPGPYAVPLTAPIEGGSASSGDRHAISIDTDNCILYELYAAYPQTSSWQAGSGAIFSLGSNALRPSGWTSADAAGLPIFPGLVRFDEIVAGEIRHALRFTVPQTQRAFVWPARHYASSLTAAQYPPMGVRFRLRANFDISGYSQTNQIILKALKKYGMMIADNGSAWFISGAPDSRWDNTDLHNLGAVHGSDFEVVDVSGLMVDPNSGQALQSSAVSVTVTPATASVQINTTQQFNAIVNNSTNQTVTWSVSASGGAINSTTGFYTAPASVPAGPVTVTATSSTSPAVSGTATVTVTNPPPPVSITISPTSATVRVNRTRAFTATVQNASDTSVAWKVNGITGGNSTVGTISSLGTYKAPSAVPAGGTVQVSAVSNADSTKSASATVTVVRR